MPTPSIAAAIITPASEDLDSRMSSVCIALPAPTDISCASCSRPASRHAPAGSRRKRARNSRSARSRSISFAATSASDGVIATRSAPADPLPERLAEDEEDRQEEGHPERRHHTVHRRLRHAGGEERLLVAQRHPDREQRRDARPDEAEDPVAREHGPEDPVAGPRGRVGGGATPGQPRGKLLLPPPPQPRLAEPVHEHVVAV